MDLSVYTLAFACLLCVHMCDMFMCVIGCECMWCMCTYACGVYVCICVCDMSGVWYVYICVCGGLHVLDHWFIRPVNHICVQWLWSDLGVDRAVQGSVPKSPCVRQGALLALLVSELTAPSVRPAPPGPARPRAISSRRAAGPQHRAGGPRPSVLSRPSCLR